jgi:hypothetical protein
MAKAGELKKIWNDDWAPFIQEFIDNIQSATEAYCAEDAIAFQNISRRVKVQYQEIMKEFNLESNEVIKFACNYNIFKNLIEGRFHGQCDDHLYFIEGNGFIKIGRTEDPKARIGQLQTSSPARLQYIKIFKFRGLHEFSVHRIFKHLRVKGEWFKDSPEIRKYISLLSKENRELTSNIYGL